MPQKRRGKKEEVFVPKIRIPRFTNALWKRNGNHLLEVLIATQLLFLNNFCEPLCKKAKQVLKTIFDKLTLVKGELIVGESIPDEASGEVTSYPLFETKEGITKQIKLNVILVSCAMLYT